jgi:predicted dithiol-disulfide oxidoreductase (DUF899 family)
MCPACIATLAWSAASVASTGSITALVVNKLRGKNKEENMEMPKVVSREEWLRARKELLVKEKEWSRQREAQGAERRKLPMVRIDKDYVFEGPAGRRTLGDLFEGRRQLIVYHFMFDPSWDEGCPSCSFVADNFPRSLAHFAARDTSFAVISRAPIEKIERFKKRMGWDFPWLSSFDSDFNYDFQVTIDEAHQEYNYRHYYPIASEMAARYKGPPPGEGQGLSVFLRDRDRIYHAYSTFQRGLDPFLNTYNFLDHTPLGRQEEGQLPMGWVRHHDKY